MLEAKLESLASLIGQIGLGAGLLAFTALASQFSWQHFVVEGQSWNWSLAPTYLRFLIISITILVSRLLESAVSAFCINWNEIVVILHYSAYTM